MYTARLIVLHPTLHKPGSWWDPKPHTPRQEHTNNPSVTGPTLDHLQHARGLQLERTTSLISACLHHDYSMQAAVWLKDSCVWSVLNQLCWLPLLLSLLLSLPQLVGFQKLCFMIRAALG